MHIQRTVGFCWSRRAHAGSVLNTGKRVQTESRLVTKERSEGARKSISARHSGDSNRNSRGSSHMVQVKASYWWTSDWVQSWRDLEHLNPRLFRAARSGAVQGADPAAVSISSTHVSLQLPSTLVTPEPRP